MNSTYFVFLFLTIPSKQWFEKASVEDPHVVLKPRFAGLAEELNGKLSQFTSLLIPDYAYCSKPSASSITTASQQLHQ